MFTKQGRDLARRRSLFHPCSGGTPGRGSGRAIATGAAAAESGRGRPGRVLARSRSTSRPKRSRARRRCRSRNRHRRRFLFAGPLSPFSRAAKSSSDQPRLSAARRSRSERGASTNTTRSQRSSQPASSRIAASSTTGRPDVPAAAQLLLDRLEEPRPHQRMNDRLQGSPSLADRRRRSPPELRDRPAARRRGRPVIEPARRRRNGRRAAACTAGRSSTSCPTESASITAQPRSASRLATELLPLATPPVRPMTGAVPCFQRLVRAAREIARLESSTEVLLSTEGRSISWHSRGHCPIASTSGSSSPDPTGRNRI